MKEETLADTQIHHFPGSPLINTHNGNSALVLNYYLLNTVFKTNSGLFFFNLNTLKKIMYIMTTN